MDHEIDYPDLHILSVDPMCAGPDPEALVETYVTSTERHFIRNHGPVPSLDPANHRLRVGGLVEHELELSVEDLVAHFPQRNVVATLQCAGNRRQELDRIHPYQNEVLWGGEAIGTAVWSGAALGDILRRAAVQPYATHIWFEGADRVATADGSTMFGSEIPLERALVDDVVIAYEMNHAPLTAMHGAPMRVVVPGRIGARSVKWLARITVADRPSENPFEVDGYRFRLPDDPNNGIPLIDMPLNSFISTPTDRATVPAGSVRVLGYATGRGLGSLAAVELAVDESKFRTVTLLDLPASGVWVRWECVVDLAVGRHSIVVRATGSDGASQPADVAERWNVRGYMNDAWHRIQVLAKPAR